MRTIIIAATATLTLTSCSASHDTAAPASPTAKPSPTYDGSTLDACKEAQQAISDEGKDYRHSHAARSFAALSDVPALRETARKYSDAPAGTMLDNVRALTAATTIDTWCLQHGVTKVS